MKNNQSARQAPPCEVTQMPAPTMLDTRYVEIHISAANLADLDQQLNEVRGRLSEGSLGGTNVTHHGGRYRFSMEVLSRPIARHTINKDQVGVRAQPTADSASVTDFGDLPATKAFELTLPGFDGGSDETDDRVLWVLAQDEAAVQRAITGLGVKVCQLLQVASADADYVLPEQGDALRKRIKALTQVEPRVASAAA